MAIYEKEGFKMLEKPAPGSFDPKVLVKQHVAGVKEEEKVFGPAFSRMVAENTLSFLSERTKEKPPEGITTMEQVAQYSISKLSEYPSPQCAMLYAQYKTERMLEGQVGSAHRLSGIGWQRKTMEVKDRKGERQVNFDAMISDFAKAATMLKVRPEIGYRKNANGTLDLLLPSCYYKDGCREATKEGLTTRQDGKKICSVGVNIGIFLKAATGYEWDYECVEYDKPHCMVRLTGL